MENRAISTARMATVETPKGGRGRLPRPAVVVLPDVSGADTCVITELEQSCLGHQFGDLLGVELGGVHGGSRKFLDRDQLVVGRNTGGDGVLEGSAVLQDLLALLAGDELQEGLGLVRVLRRLQDTAARDREERARV